jgi:hypothetical protein
LRPARTILAVLLGYLVWFGVLLGGGVLFGAIAGRNAHVSQVMLIGEVVMFVAGVAAGAVTAAVADARPLLHAMVLGVAMMAVLMLGAAFSKRVPTPGIPPWYPYAAALLAAAGTFVGGSLATRPKRAP